MENSTAENVLEKTFAHLDRIIEEKKQNNASADDTRTENENSEEHPADESSETVEEKGRY